MSCTSPVIVAFDTNQLSEVERLATELDPELCRAKVGKELFTRYGMQAVDTLHSRGFDVFLDLKFHDIPNTVAKAVCVAAEAGLWMVNVHASGGSSMMAAAREAVDRSGSNTLLIAVTVLTSMQQEDLAQTGVKRPIAEQVQALAKLAQEQGLDGVVCSAQEAAMLRAQFTQEFCLVTPGIRPANTSSDDQKRVCTPKEALALGSSYLVVGRPITQSDNPHQSLQEIINSLKQ